MNAILPAQNALPSPRSPVRSSLALTSLLALSAAGLVSTQTVSAQSRVVITPNPGYEIVWDGNNGGFSSPDPGVGPGDNEAHYFTGTVAFGSSAFLPGGIHDFINVNDGFYGNSSSWISDFALPDPDPFVGLNFGRTVEISSIAWSRDNGDDAERTPPGPFTDRAVGVYTLQFTRAGSPDEFTEATEDPATGWATIGTVEYLPGTDSVVFSAYLRHRFDVSAGGEPISATGLRLKVSDPGMAIDEIEVNPEPDPEPPISNFIVIEPAAGVSITWNGNDGAFFDPGSPARVPDNRALASRGTVPFGSSEFGADVHLIAHINDGLYGNSQSWIANFATPDPDPYIGLNFGELIQIRDIAWSRDNGDDIADCCGGQTTDRSLGTYTLQVTQVADPGVDTEDTGDASTGWRTIGTVQYKAEGLIFRPYLRHSFAVAQGGEPIAATGLRIEVSDPSIAIDEIEVNLNPAAQIIADGLLVLEPVEGYSLNWDGNDGEFYNPNAGAAAPDNIALASHGSIAFASGQLLPPGVHDIARVNDGLYGNTSSWIPGAQAVDPWVDPFDGPYIGIRFAEVVPISSIAWGRDNGNNPGDCCGGQLTDRWEGTYTLQVTMVSDAGVATTVTEDPSTGWVTIGSVTYNGQAPPNFNPWLRHRYEVAMDGEPITASALRILVSNGAACIDEIEVNPAGEAPVGPIVIAETEGYAINWNGNQGNFSTPDSPARAAMNDALASRGTAAFGSSEFGADVHLISHINDGLYGNSRSWIPKFTDPADPNPFIGLNFGRTIEIENIAWSRDNGDASDCCGGELVDRAVGVYTIQITRAASPGVDTAETGDPSTGWATIGTIEYTGAEDALFRPHLRHRFDVSAEEGSISATGLRIKVSAADMAIDELEVNADWIQEGEVLELSGSNGVQISWDGNDGLYHDPAEGAAAPDNLALAIHGVLPFGSSEFGSGAHLISHINDGLYGNSFSWIPDFTAPDPDPFIGLNFGERIEIGSIAWGRDNGNDPGDCCGGQLTDRWEGTYVVQITTAENPGLETVEAEDPELGWVTIATVSYYSSRPPDFRPWLRHEFQVSRGGMPVEATGLRIKAPGAGTCIDEIEVYGAAETPPFLAIAAGEGGGLVISWTGGGTLQSAEMVDGPWTDVTSTTPAPVEVTGSARFYRVWR